MVVEVDGGDVRGSGDAASADARRIRFASALAGPVQAVDAAAGTLTLLGQTVRVAVDTVFDERLALGLASLRAGRTVVVHGLYDAASGAFDATRIEPRLLLVWRLRAPVSALDAAARTLGIGSAQFVLDGATGVPADLAVGLTVSLRLAARTDAQGRYVVTAFGLAPRLPADRAEARVRGRVTSLTSLQRFDVEGLAVDASAASFPDGSAGLALGARVDARGAVAGGVLRAETVRVESDRDVRERGFELEGAIMAVDTAARTFRLRGLQVSYARADLRVDDGTLADLAVGRQVEVRAQLAGDRVGLEATRIKFK